MQDFAKVLDALMGKDRNKPLSERKAPEKIDFRDPSVCPYFLVEYCPHEMFVNTKSDIGPCQRSHDPKVKAAWDALSEREQWATGLPKEMLYLAERLVADMDARIRRNEKRSGVDPEVGVNLDQAGKAAQQEQLDAIESKISEIVAQMDKLAEEGEVDELDSLVSKMERFKEEKEELLRVGGERGAPKAMRVCDICGAYLVATDPESRIQAHLQGKLHVGFYSLRLTIKNLQQKAAEMGDVVVQSSSSTSSSRRSRSRSRESHRRKRSRSRDRRRSRSRSRERTRTRRRSRSRERGRHSRSRDRSRRKSPSPVAAPVVAPVAPAAGFAPVAQPGAVPAHGEVEEGEIPE